MPQASLISDMATWSAHEAAMTTSSTSCTHSGNATGACSSSSALQKSTRLSGDRGWHVNVQHVP